MLETCNRKDAATITKDIFDFTSDNGISKILKHQAIKNVFSYSGCIFSTI